MSNDNILGLPPIGPGYGFGANFSVINPEGRALPKGEIREINQDSIRRRVAIDILAKNNEDGIKLVLRLDQNGFVSYCKSARFITETMVESQGKPYEKYCKAFGERMLQVAAHHTNAFVEAGAARIAYEINRPPQMEDAPKGFLGTLFR